MSENIKLELRLLLSKLASIITKIKSGETEFINDKSFKLEADIDLRHDGLRLVWGRNFGDPNDTIFIQSEDAGGIEWSPFFNCFESIKIDDDSDNGE